jgi:hypothetical protein
MRLDVTSVVIVVAAVETVANGEVFISCVCCFGSNFNDVILVLAADINP